MEAIVYRSITYWLVVLALAAPVYGPAEDVSGDGSPTAAAAVQKEAEIPSVAPTEKVAEPKKVETASAASIVSVAESPKPSGSPDKLGLEKYRPEEQEAILPLRFEKGLVFDLGRTQSAKSGVLTLVNYGKKAIIIKTITVGSPFFIEKNDCNGEVKGGGKCDLTVKVEATKRGSYTSRLEVSTSSKYGQDSWYMVVKAEWIRPAIVRAKGEFSFGDVTTGKRVEKKITFTNEGDAKAENLEISLASPGQFFMGKDECGGELAVGRSCVATVVFEPKANGMHQDVLKVAHKVEGEKVVVENSLSGSGLRPAKLLLTVPESGALGDRVLGLKLEFDWILSNLGDVPAERIEDVSVVKAPFSYRKRPFPGEGGTCRATLGPRDNCRIAVTFEPLFKGSAKQDFSIKYFDGQDSQTVSTSFNATGLTPARIAVKEPAPGALQPTIMTKTTDRRFHVVNEGESDATELQLAPNDFRTQFKLLNLHAAEEGELCQQKSVLKPNEVCEFAVSFQSDKGGDFESSVSIKFNDGFRSQSTKYPFRARALSSGRVTFEDKQGLDFGKVTPGEAKTVFLKITNDGEHRVERLAMHGLAAPFTLKQKAESEVPRTLCGQEIDDGKSCVFPLEYKNTQAGEAKQTIKFTYFDGLKERETTYTLKAQGQKPAQIDLAEGTGIDFEEKLATSDSEKAVIIKNTGNLPARDLSITVASDADKSPYGIAQNACASSLEPDKTCEIKIKFKPTDAGQFPAKIIVAYADEHIGAKRSEIPVAGKAHLPARLAFETASIDFGTVKSGEEVERELVLKNEGGNRAQKIFVNFGGDSSGYGWRGGKFPGDGGDCTDELLAKANCKLAIVFKDTKGQKSAASLIMSFDDGVRPQRLEVALGGKSVVPGKVTFSKTSIDFGPRIIGKPNGEEVVLRNAGGSEIAFLHHLTALSAPFEFIGGKYPGERGTCENNLGPGAECKLVIGMNLPQEETADGTLILAFKDEVTAQSELTLPLSGSSRHPAEIAGAGDNDFGSVFVGDKKTVHYDLTNEGGWDTQLNIVASDSQLVAEGCKSLKSKERCTLNITFSPTQKRVLDGKITVKYSSGVENKEFIVSVKGAADKLARISLGKSVLDFGTVKVEERRNKLVTLKNEGDVDAAQFELSGIKDASVGFDGSFPGKSGNCSYQLPAGQECIIDISYAPSAPGASEQNLELKYFNGKEMVSAPLMVRGVAEAGPGEANRAIASEPQGN